MGTEEDILKQSIEKIKRLRELTKEISEEIKKEKPEVERKTKDDRR